jgi:hypothetical protein
MGSNAYNIRVAFLLLFVRWHSERVGVPKLSVQSHCHGRLDRHLLYLALFPPRPLRLEIISR